MNFLKTVFAVFAGAVLLASQTVFAWGQQEFSKPQVCCCCACKMINCCVAQPTSPVQPIPAAPARTVSQHHYQIVSTIAALLLQSPEKSPEKISLPPLASLDPAAVPLYQRNCSYLI